MRKLVLRNFQSPGDVLMLTAAVRDLSLRHSNEFQIDVRTSVPELWCNNPFLTSLPEWGSAIERIECKYESINQSNKHPAHFVSAFHHFLGKELCAEIPLSAFKGDVHLSDSERLRSPFLSELDPVTPYWLLSAGGKQDYTIKWWDTRRFQAVIDHFQGRLTFIQVGAAGHFHPKIHGAIDLRGRTSIRELIQLVHRADGVLTPVSFLMHLAAAVEPAEAPSAFARTTRACVVVAGGREPPNWEAYPTHQFMHTVGTLSCCQEGGCWRSRTRPLGDGSTHDSPRRLCVNVVEDLPRCMDMITAEDVIRRIEWYLDSPLTKRKPTINSGRRSQMRVRNPPPGALTPETVAAALEDAVSSIPSYSPRRFSARGVVICAGGLQYLTSAWVCVSMLRQNGCFLPIQIWHIGQTEVPNSIKPLFEALGVEFVDAIRVSRTHAARRLGGWELKAFAILNCSFREVILLDADNVPLIDPEVLFGTAQFLECGAIFWPDLGRLSHSDPIWNMCRIPFVDEPEFESGQLIVDKSRCWSALSLAGWMNDQSDFFYQVFHGDKETFHLAFRKLNKSFAMPSTPVLALAGAMCQHDFEGNRIFQHRNLLKWQTFSPNQTISGFRLEGTCLGFLAELEAREVWREFAVTERAKPSYYSIPRVDLRNDRSVLLRAPIDAYTGYGLHACQILRDLNLLGLNVDVLPTCVRETFTPIPTWVRARIVSCADSHRRELLLHPPELSPDGLRSTIYFTMWETTRIRDHHVANLNRAGAVIVPSKWNRDCFIESGVTVPIFVVPLGINTDEFQYSEMTLSGPCIFGTGGRLADSDPARKSVDQVIAAFLRAFPNEQDVELRIKLFPDCDVPPAYDKRIKFTRRYMSEPEMKDWFCSLTCFVSGAKAEGWGLMQHQALATGRPLISVRYGGLKEFFEPDFGYVIPHREIPAQGRFVGSGDWAEPEEHGMIEAMREVYRNRDEAARLGKRATRAVSQLNWQNSNEKLLEVLKTVWW